jgi:hypothetical protein
LRHFVLESGCRACDSERKVHDFFGFKGSEPGVDDCWFMVRIDQGRGLRISEIAAKHPIAANIETLKMTESQK